MAKKSPAKVRTKGTSSPVPSEEEVKSMMEELSEETPLYPPVVTTSDAGSSTISYDPVTVKYVMASGDVMDSMAVKKKYSSLEMEYMKRWGTPGDPPDHKAICALCGKTWLEHNDYECPESHPEPPHEYSVQQKEYMKRWGTIGTPPDGSAICALCGYDWYNHSGYQCTHTPVKGKKLSKEQKEYVKRWGIPHSPEGYNIACQLCGYPSKAHTGYKCPKGIVPLKKRKPIEGVTCKHCPKPAIIRLFWDELPVCAEHISCYGAINRFSSGFDGDKEAVMDTLRGTKHSRMVKGLDPKLVIQEAAANFYLMCEYSIDHPEYKPKLEKYTKYLADNFSKYMVCSIMGEARHIRLYSYKTEERREQIEKVVDKLKEKYEVKFDFWDWFQLKANKPTDNPMVSRETMWEETQEIEKEVPPVFLAEFCSKIFKMTLVWGGSGSSMGGKRWAIISKTLYDYLSGESTPIMFVDTAFGLEHNGDCHFNKIWNIRNLKEILNYNAEGKLNFVGKWASDEVLKEVKWAERIGEGEGGSTFLKKGATK